MNSREPLPRIPDSLLSSFKTLKEGRAGGWLNDERTPVQAKGPPVLFGEMDLPEPQATELAELFRRHHGGLVEKPPDGIRSRMVLSPRCIRWSGGKAEVELTILLTF